MSNRLHELARGGALHIHSWFFDAAENIDGVDPASVGHSQPFETCPHSDCALVRVAASGAGARKDEGLIASEADVLNTELRENYGDHLQVEPHGDWRCAILGLVDGVRHGWKASGAGATPPEKDVKAFAERWGQLTDRLLTVSEAAKDLDSVRQELLLLYAEVAEQRRSSPSSPSLLALRDRWRAVIKRLDKVGDGVHGEFCGRQRHNGFCEETAAAIAEAAQCADELDKILAGVKG